VTQVALDQLGRLALQALLGTLARREQLVPKVTRDSQDIKASRATRGVLVLLEYLEVQARRVHRALRDRLGHRVLEEIQVHQVILVHKVILDQVASLVQLDFQGLGESPEQLVRLVLKDHQEALELKDQEEIKD
jgi:hypothetical protein